MATVSAFHSLTSIGIPTPTSHRILNIRSLQISKYNSQTHSVTHSLKQSLNFLPNYRITDGIRKLRSVTEETLIPEEEEASAVESSEPVEQQPVAVPVSPSDTLTMFFQAEGVLSESAIPKVTKALEETEGITDLKVQVLEGIASVELAKETTVQASGVASSLVEIIQSSGFKLQTLNLSFKDDEEIVV